VRPNSDFSAGGKIFYLLRRPGEKGNRDDGHLGLEFARHGFANALDFEEKLDVQPAFFRSARFRRTCQPARHVKLGSDGHNSLSVRARFGAGVRHRTARVVIGRLSADAILHVFLASLQLWPVVPAWVPNA
jgi:hypothetical protein